MRFAVVGDRGMFGAEMVDLLSGLKISTTGLNRDSCNLDSSFGSLSKQLDSFDVIINAVAYTAVDKAESEPELANLINGDYAGKLARVAGAVGAKFIHISTDYVFDGLASSPYLTNSQTNPKSAYGSSKLLGEKLVKESGSNYTIFRTAWLYGKHGRSFPKVIFQKASIGDPLRVVDDQFGQPTWTKDLAKQVMAFSTLPNAPKIVHAVSSGKASWFQFAKEIVGDYPIEGVPSSEFATEAKRPNYSVLDNSSELVPPIGDWRERWRVAKTEILGKK